MNETLMSSADVWCDTTIRVTKVSMIWTIRDFGLLESKPGKYIRSSTFSDSNDSKTTWFLELYPNGHKEDLRDFVSVFLCLESSDRKELQTKFSFYIINKRGEKTNRFEANYCFKVGGDWGYSRYVVRTTLLDPKNGLVPNDTLNLMCELSFNGDPITLSGRTTRESYDYLLSEHRNIIDDMIKLFNKPRFFDVVLVVGRKEFKAHKLILQIRSPVFEAMFKHPTEESQTNRVLIEDISPQVFAQLLRYVYTGDRYNIDMEQSTDLLIASDKYGITDLKYICQRYIISRLTADNVCENLLMADKYSAEVLKESAIEFISKNAKKVVATDGWNLLATNQDLLKDCFLALAQKPESGSKD